MINSPACCAGINHIVWPTKVKGERLQVKTSSIYEMLCKSVSLSHVFVSEGQTFYLFKEQIFLHIWLGETLVCPSRKTFVTHEGGRKKIFYRNG